jgi:Uma2 family endonuclease
MSTDRKDFPQHYYSVDEYFSLEKSSDARFEYWDGEIVCMSGGSQRHYRISRNVVVRLQLQLAGKQCEAFTGDLPVKTPTLPPYRYPDITVACGVLKFESVQGIDVLVNPVLLVEVVSPATALRDQNEKFSAYQAIPTFTEYLLISQEMQQVTHYTRQSGGKWMRADVTDPTAVVALDSIGCSLLLREIYEGVAFERG